MASKGQTFKFFLEGVADLDIKGIKSGVQQANKYLSNIKMPDDLKEGFNKQIKDILSDVDKFQKKMEVGFHSEKEVQKAYQDYDKILKQIERFQKEANKLSPGTGGGLELISSNSIKQFREAKTAYDQIIKSTKEFDGAWTEVTKNLSRTQKVDFDIETLIKGAAAGEDLEAVLKRSSTSIDARLGQLKTTYEKEAQLHAELQKRINNQEKLAIEHRNTFRRLDAKKSSQGDSLTQQKAKIEQLEEEKKAVLALQAPYTALMQKLQNLQFDGSTRSLQELQTIMQELATQHGQELAGTLEQVADGADRAKTAAEGMKEPMANFTKAGADLAETNKQMGQLESRMTHFFSLANGWNLIRRAMRNAFNAVADLDQEMTEIAVVTEMTLDQVWARRDMYVKTARELGAATLDVVAASKLYYQQGLSEAEVNTITTETIKMARIAHLDGARATDLMTAALRGFNLEMSQAAHVNDVYSQLAAKSAADTEEIANAMTKTASIAYSAGASLDNTAAFLTQMIETTREASENLGTAMKTIVARFQEMKKAPSEVGEIDGEIVDANKFETALKTVGIALRDLRTGEFRNFDDVIMEISEKWDSMDQLTQRYIATTAAGSRQQSRFIALVSNHSRLLELTGLAADSSGASQEQFNKTLDSLESKLNQLKNGLELFYTTLMNSSVIKFAVDALTKIIDLVNNLTQKFGSLGGTVVGAATAFAAFSGGGKILTSIFSKLATTWGVATGKEMSTSMMKTFFSNLDNKTIEKRLKSVFSVEGLKGQFTELRAAISGFEPDEILKLDSIYKEFDTLSAAMEMNIGVSEKMLLSMSEEQLASLNIVVSQEMQTASLGNLTAAQTQANLQKAVSNQLTEDGIKVQQAEVAATIGLGKATKNLVTSLIMYLKGKLFRNAVDAKGEKLNQEQIKNNLKNAASTWVKTAANYGYIASIVAIIAAIGLLVYALADSIKTDKERMALMQANAEKYENEIEKTKKSIDDLKSAHEDLDSKTEVFYGLTKGTIEWREALIDVNNKVLEILTNYPKIAPFLEKGKYGELAIGSEGYEKIIELQNQRLAQQQQAQLLNQIGMLETSFKINQGRGLRSEETQIIQEFITLGHKIEDLKDYQSEAVRDLAQLYKERGLGDEASAAFLSFKSEVIKSEEGLIDFSQAAVQAAKELRGLEEAFVYSIASSDNQLAEMAADQALQPLLEASSVFGKAGEKIREEAEKQAREISNKSAWYNWLTGWAYRGATREAYSELTGLTEAEIKLKLKNKEISYELMNQEIAAARVNKEYTEIIKDNIKILKNLPKDLQGSFINIIREGGSGSNKQDLDSTLEALGLSYDALLDQEGKEAALAILEKSENSQSLIKLLGLDEDDYEGLYNYFNDLVSKREEAIAETRNKLANRDQIFYDALIKDLDTKRIEELGGKIEEVALSSGEEASGFLVRFLAGLEKDLSAEKFDSVVDFAKTTDFKDTAAIKEFTQHLREIGIGWDSNAIDSIEEDLINVNRAIYQLSLEELEGKVRNIGKLLRDIGRTGKTTFTEDEYKNLIKEAPELALDFTEDLDGNFHYLGGSMGDLTIVLQKLLKQQQEDAITKKETQVEAGKLAKRNIAYGPTGTTYEQAKLGNLGQQKEFLKGYIEDLKGKGVDISTILGIDENTSLSNKDEEFIAGLMDKVHNLVTELEPNEADLARFKQNLAVAQLEQRQPLAILDDSLYTEDTEAHTKALIIQGEKYSELAKYVQEMRQALTSKNSEEIKSTRNILAQAIAYKDATSKLNTYKDDVDDLVDSLKGIKDAEVEDVLRNFNFIFNEILDLGLSNEFLADKENYELLIEVLDGSEEAWDSLIEKVSSTREEVLKFAEDFGKSADWVDQATQILDDSDFLITGEADVTQLVDQLVTAGATTEEAIALLEKLGNSSIQAKPVYDLQEVAPGLLTRVMIGYTYEYVPGTPSKQLGKGTRLDTNPFRDRKKDAKSKSGGGKDKAEAPWEHSYDWLYNLVQKTNKEIRKRNILEWEYGKLLTDNKQSIKDVLENVKKQEASLKQQQQYYADQAKGRKIELEVIEKGFTDVSGYARYDKELGAVQIDWAAIDKVTDKAKGDRIADYIKELERIQSELENIEDAQRDTIDKLDELEKLGRDEYLELEQRVLEAVIASRQYEIDNLQAINESINDGNSRLLDKLQKGIDAQRKARQEEKTLENLQKKERRLALLQQDPTGVNALEILKLEEELANERQSYTDTLIDNVLQELQESHDAATRQRELQIQLMQQQLEFEIAQGELWEQVHALINSAIGEDGELKINSSLATFLANWEETDSMSALSKKDWNDNLNTQLRAGLTWYTKDSNDIGTVTTAVSGLETPLVNAIKNTQNYYPKPNTTKDPSGSKTASNTARANTLLKDIKALIPKGKTITVRVPPAKGGTSRTPGGFGGGVQVQMAYAQGGLADFTGPAWLDGTKSKPEMVLDPQDTKNFISLKNILGDILSGSNGISSKGSGDNYYQFEVKVDQLSNDYDVEQLVNKMKRLITDDAQYRNVNALSMGLR